MPSDAVANTPIRRVVILPPDAMSEKYQELLRDSGICVVECKEPELVRFLDPPPADYSAADKAAIELFRIVLRGGLGSLPSRTDLIDTWARILMNCPKPTPVPSAPANQPRKKLAT